MSVIGVIAEFNPLHNGHIELLNHARTGLKAEYVVVVMSGDFTQRGNPAMISKYDRAKLALKHGADLIIELPVIASTSSAETFAKSGIAHLNATGIVTHLLFGCEDANMEMFRTAANLASSDSMDYHKTINAFVKQGDSYAVARQKAIQMQQKGVELPPDFLSKPNNILGVEYVKALASDVYDIEPVCYPRTSSAHDSKKLGGAAASGSAIRNAMETNQAQAAQPSIPDDVMKLLRFNAQFRTLLRSSDISQLLHYKLISSDDFSEYLDCNEDISNKINKMKDRFVEFENFCSLLKSKDLTYARISRVLLHIALGITAEDRDNLEFCNFAPYLRILGFSKAGTALLTHIKNSARVPFFLSPQGGMPQLNTVEQSILKKDVYASDVYRTLLTSKSGRVFPTEFTRKFELKDING
ncbi:MAG: nucleotidyltransferase family protein [Lachnospiraceae bacterium]|nr:nucleotidyltransferase family protein [Lachnospiraceae bacterium]